MDGVDEALEAGRRYGVHVVPATELSAIDGPFENLHVLGYGLDHHDASFVGALKEFRADRAAPAHRTVDALRDLGFELDDAAICKREAAGHPRFSTCWTFSVHGPSPRLGPIAHPG